MERYSRTQLIDMNPTPAPTLLAESDSILSDFDCHHLTLLSGQEQGWQAELHRYLKDMPANVTKETDIVEWWQVHSWL